MSMEKTIKTGRSAAALDVSNIMGHRQELAQEERQELVHLGALISMRLAFLNKNVLVSY